MHAITKTEPGRKPEPPCRYPTSSRQIQGEEEDEGRGRWSCGREPGRKDWLSSAHHSLSPCSISWLACLALCLGLFIPNVRPARAELAAQLFDTGTASPLPLQPDALSKKDLWTLLPEDDTSHVFRGDAVFANGRLAVVLRREGRAAEIYALTPKGPVQRAGLVAVADAPAAALASVKIVENNPGTVAVDATFKTDRGRLLTIGYELSVGQVFVRTLPRSGTVALRVEAPCRFAVLPDFFADDIAVDAAELAVPETELPSENFLLHMLGEGEAIVMAVWHPAQDDVRITLAGQGQTRSITGSEIRYAPEGQVCVAVLSAPGTWHRRDITPAEAGKIIRLDWKTPYTAHWRVDWRLDNRLTDSWEMLTQKPDGTFVKHGWYGQPEAFGNDDWLKEDRKRWTTVLGFFLYPCWIDRQGQGHLQPLEKGLRFQGPAILYPITRLEGTPLEQFTVVDIMRATLGVGPCEYILDVEGQKKTFQGTPTCASRTILDNIYASKEQKQKTAEVRKTLDQVLAFVRHIRTRIEEYIVFGHDMSAYLQAQKQTHPHLAESLTQMQGTIRDIDAALARRKERIKTPDYATALVDDFRITLVDYEGPDALAKCQRITAALVDIGGNQDELVGECRLAVKRLRQHAALAMTTEPRLAPIAREIRVRTQRMLRTPTSYEAPRH